MYIKYIIWVLQIIVVKIDFGDYLSARHSILTLGNF